MSWNRPYNDDRDDDRFDLPFADESKWEDGDRTYDEMVDEQVLEHIAAKRYGEMVDEIVTLRKEVKRLDNENAALRKMLTAAALVGKQGW